MRDVLVGTAGHIDHGKTTLVKALTGIDADRLQEEKRRGITIDIGFAWMELGDFRVGFVDLPGHEKFVKNMLAGVGSIQLVLLVVAADESVMPQTVEHFRICQLLGIPRGIVVLTKSRLAEPDLVDLVEEEVHDLVADTFLEGAPVVAVDSLDGTGIDRLKQVVLEELAELPQLDSARRIFRMPIDRVFSSRGFGTIVTGTPLAGSIQKNETLDAYPDLKSGKVRSVQVFGESEEAARAGQRTALNLAGLERSDLDRGMVLAPPGAFQSSAILDVSIQVLPDAPAPIAHRDPIRFHQGSAEVMGRIYLLEGNELAPSDEGLAQIRLDRPIVTCALDHFILRRYSPMTTIAGGVILDSQAPKHRKKELRRTLPDLRKLDAARRQQQPDIESLFLHYFVLQSGTRGISVRELGARMGLKKESIRELLEGSEQLEIVSQELIVSKSQILQLQAKVLSFLEQFHARQPLLPGVSQEELKNRTMPGVSGGLTQYVLQTLASEERIAVDEGLVRNSQWNVSLTDRQKSIQEEILATFKPQTLATPSLSEVLEAVKYPENETREVYFYLIQRGHLVRVAGDILLSQEQLAWMLGLIEGSYRAGDSFGVAEFKALFDISRKFAIPYLEFLDRRRVTRRVGDQRVVL